MRLSHSRLEEIRRNPTLLRATGASAPRRFSRFRALQFSTYKVHSEGLDQAVGHLERLYARNFKRPEGLPPLVDRLRAYEVNYRALGTIAVETNVRMALAVTPADALIGEVARIDLDPVSGGSRLWLLAPSTDEWRPQLRMPLMQRWLAGRLGAPDTDVTVGFYFFDTGRYESECFTSDAIEDAVEEMRRLVAAA